MFYFQFPSHRNLSIYDNGCVFVLPNGNYVNILFRNLCYVRDFTFKCRGPRGRDRIIVGFTTTCAISAYHS